MLYHYGLKIEFKETIPYKVPYAPYKIAEEPFSRMKKIGKVQLSGFYIKSSKLIS